MKPGEIGSTWSTKSAIKGHPPCYLAGASLALWSVTLALALWSVTLALIQCCRWGWCWWWSYDHDDSQAFIRMIASIIALSLSLMILIATACYYHDMSWLWCFFVPRGVRSTRQGKMPKLIKQHTSACQWRGTGCWTHTVAERKSLYVFVPRAESGVRGKGKCQNWLSNTHQLANGAAQAAEPIQSQKESLCMSLCVHELDG